MSKLITWSVRVTSTKLLLRQALVPFAISAGIIMTAIPAYADQGPAPPPPPPPDLTRLPGVKADLNQDVAGATSDHDRMQRDIHRGQVLGYYGDAGAIPSFKEAVTIARKLADQTHANASSQRDLRDALNELCKFLDYDAALKCYREGLGIARHLVFDEHGSDAANRDLVSSLFLIGETAWQKQDLPTALATFQEGLKLSRVMFTRYPKTNAFRYYWQAQAIVALQNLPSIPGSGIGWDEYTREMSERTKDMKDHGFSDPQYID